MSLSKRFNLFERFVQIVLYEGKDPTYSFTTEKRTKAVFMVF